MPQILNVPNFKGIRIHGGNDHEDTEGCLIVAENWDGHEKVWGSQEAVFTKMIETSTKNGHEVYIEIINLPQVG